MGLDTSLYKQKIKPEIEQVFDKLVGNSEEIKEIEYWRKNYNLVDWFENLFGEMENTEYYEVTEDIFLAWLEALETGKLVYAPFGDDEESATIEMKKDIEMIKKILKETDFNKYKFYIWSWW